MVGADAARVVPVSVAAEAGVARPSTERKLNAIVPAAHAVTARRNLLGPCFISCSLDLVFIAIVVTSGLKSPRAHDLSTSRQLVMLTSCDRISRLRPRTGSPGPGPPSLPTHRHVEEDFAHFRFEKRLPPAAEALHDDGGCWHLLHRVVETCHIGTVGGNTLQGEGGGPECINTVGLGEYGRRA